MEAKKLAILRILQILEEHTDFNHPMTQEEIHKRLVNDYGIDIERKAVSRNLGLSKVNVLIILLSVGFCRRFSLALPLHICYNKRNTNAPKMSHTFST